MPKAPVEAAKPFDIPYVKAVCRRACLSIHSRRNAAPRKAIFKHAPIFKSMCINCSDCGYDLANRSAPGGERWRQAMKQRTQTCYFPGGEKFSPGAFSKKLEQFVLDYYKKNGPCPILFLCIGSDRITGDSLGPLVGYKLEKHLLDPSGRGTINYQVIGTLSHPVHALNLKDASSVLKRQKASFLTIAIDASVGMRESCGSITLSNQPLSPGEGVHRNLPRVGHISVTGIVSDDSCDHPFRLQNIRLCSVMELADSIFQGLLTFLYSCSSLLPAPNLIPDFPDRSFGVRPASACASDPCQDAFHRYP